MPVVLFLFFRPRRFDFCRLNLAAGGGGGHEQRPAVFQARGGIRNRLAVRIVGGCMFEPDDIGARRFQLYFQPLAFDHEVQLADPVLVGVMMTIRR